MCTAAAIGQGVQAGAQVGQGISGFFAGKAASRAAKYNAEVALNNAVNAGVDRYEALRQGNIEEELYRRKLEKAKGAQRANIASGGIELGSGTAVKVLEDTAMMGEMDARNIRYNAEREAYGFAVERGQFEAQREQHLAEAKKAKVAGALSLAGSFVNVAGQFGQNMLEGLSGERPDTLGAKFGKSVRERRFKKQYVNDMYAEYGL